MKLDVIYQFPGNELWSPHYIFNKIFNLLKETYTDIHFNHINPAAFPTSIGFPSPAALAIINPENNKRIILSYLDNSRFILCNAEEYQWIPDTIQQLFCVSDFYPIKNAALSYKENKDLQVFYQIGLNDALSLNLDFDKVLKPFNYPVYFSHFDLVESDVIYSNLQPAKNREEKMLFRGYFHGTRQGVADTTDHCEISFTQVKIDPIDYANELATYRCGLSLNGVAEICNRDIELMSLGIPIIRPLLKSVEFNNSLIPNVHYIPYDYERQPILIENTTDAPLDYNYKLHTDALVEKWEEVKNDYDLLEYVGNNARNWYLENAKLDVQSKKFIEMADINSLF